MKKRLFAALLAVLMVISCTACGGTETEATGGAQESTTAAAGSNYLNVMVEVEVASLDP